VQQTPHDGIAGGEIPVDAWVILLAGVLVAVGGIGFLLLRFVLRRAADKPPSTASPSSSRRRGHERAGPPSGRT